MNIRLAAAFPVTGLAALLGFATLLFFDSAVPADPSSSAPAAGPAVQAGSAVEAGRYLVIVSSCNDCHTAGYIDNGGNVPESEWLTGSPVGWRGPWGTTYASNLRLIAQSLSEDAWAVTLHTRNARPPMPWMAVNQLSDADARAIYRYIRSLGPRGEAMPVALGPDVAPQTPYVLMVPTMPEPASEIASQAAAGLDR